MTMRMKPKIFAGLGFLACLLVAGQAAAQTCTPVPQRVNDSSAMGSVAGWTLSPTTNGWFEAGNRVAMENNGAGPYVMSQTLTKVSGGAVLAFDVAWNNARVTVGGGAGDADGNQIKLTVSYGGTIYATIDTSLLASATVADPDPGPSATTNAIAAYSGATLVSGAMPPPFPLYGPQAWVPVWGKVVLRLPEGVAQSGVLSFSAARTQSIVQPGGMGVDDLHLRNITVNDASVCLVKSTPLAPGTFNFTTTNLDADQVQAGTNASFSITTTNATAVALDADSGVTGRQPALLVGNPVTITETVPVGWTLVDMSCDNGVTVTPAGNAYTLSNITAGTAAGTMVTCTVTNSRPRITLTKSLPNGRSEAADQFTLSIAGLSDGVAVAPTVTTTGTVNTATGTVVQAAADAGATYTLTETAVGPTFMGGYTSSYSCTNATAGSPTVMPAGSGRTFALTPAASDDITCTFTNVRINAQLSITKTNNTSSVTAGGTTSYVIVVSNTGTIQVDNAVVRDDWTSAPGLDCGTVAPTCTPSNVPGTQCPASGSLTSAALGAGVQIPALPPGGAVTLNVVCQVTATGS